MTSSGTNARDIADRRARFDCPLESFSCSAADFTTSVRKRCARAPSTGIRGFRWGRRVGIVSRSYVHLLEPRLRSSISRNRLPSGPEPSSPSDRVARSSKISRSVPLSSPLEPSRTKAHHGTIADPDGPIRMAACGHGSGRPAKDGVSRSGRVQSGPRMLCTAKVGREYVPSGTGTSWASKWKPPHSSPLAGTAVREWQASSWSPTNSPVTPGIPGSRTQHSPPESG